MKLKYLLVGFVISLYSNNLLAGDCGHHLDFGVPGKSDQLLCRQGYAIGYSFVHKSPAWVAYKLTRDSVSLNVVQRKNLFEIDNEIPDEYRAVHTDYRGSGYDRGHLAPASSMDFSYQAMKESFLFSNIIPQKPGFNRFGFGHYGAWGALEKYVRSWAIARDGIYVVTGPVYHTVIDVIGNDIEIPSHFFKVIYDPEYKSSIAFLVPHIEGAAVNLSGYITTIDCIEFLAGLDFLNIISDEDEDDIENGLAYDFDHWSMRDGNINTASCPASHLIVAEKPE